MRTTLVGWKKGPWIRPASLWLDAPPVGRGLRFVSSCLVPAGRRSDRALSGAFTGRYHFGLGRPFLTAPEGEPIRLGAAKVRLLPSGQVHGAAQLHFRIDEGAVLYTAGFRPGGTDLAPPPRFLPADTWILRLDAPPEDGFSWAPWMDDLAARSTAQPGMELRVAHVWLAAELAAGLAARLDRAPRLDVPSRRTERWRRAGGPLPGPLPGDVKGDPRITLGAASEGEVILVGPDEEVGLSIPMAPNVEALCAAAREVAPEEILITGAAATTWTEALSEAGLPIRAAGRGPRRLL